MVMKRGIVFTLDVIASLVVLVAAVGVVSLLQHSAELPSVQYGNLNSIALDSVAVLEKSKVRDVEGLPVVRDLLQQGTLIDEDKNKTVMDVIGSLWAQGNLTIAQNLTESMLKGYLPGKINYEIFMGDTLIYNLTPIANPRTKITASTAVSGYRTGVPTSGYLARAWVAQATGNETTIVEMSPMGSGCSNSSCAGLGGNFTFLKPFELPQDAHDFNGTLYVSIHEEGGSVYVWINDIEQDFNLTSGTGTGEKKKKSKYTTSPVYESIGVSGFQPGNNTLKVLLTEPGTYHSHTHPGMLLEVGYLADKSIDYVTESENYQRINLTYVEGFPMVWGIFPFDIPLGSRINQVRIHVEGQDVNAYGDIHINNISVWSDNSPPLNPVVDLDVINQVYQTVGRNSTGETNTLAIYFDIKPAGDANEPGAAGIARILNTSYIILNYTLPNPAQKYGYFSFDKKVSFDRIENLIRIGREDLDNGERPLYSAVMDPQGAYAYFGTGTAPGRVVKVDLSDFDRVGAIILAAGENNLTSAVIDPDGKVAYFGTKTAPGRVVRVNLTMTPFTRIGNLTLNNGENNLMSAVMDPNGQFAYFGTGTVPGIVVKVNLTNFTRVGAITLAAGENNLTSAVIDPYGEVAYFGTATSPGMVVRVNLTTFTRIGAIALEAGENNLYSAVMDPNGGFAYFGTATSPGRVVKVDLTGFTRVGALTLAAEENALYSAVIDPGGSDAYFGTGTSPGRVVKVRLSDFARVANLTLTNGDNVLYSAVIGVSGEYAYFGTHRSPAGRVVKVKLNPRGGARTMQVDWNVSETDIVDAYLHVAQIANWMVAAAAWHNPESAPVWDEGDVRWEPVNMQIFKSPTGRNIPSSIYIRLDRLAKNATNFVTANDFGGSASNYILPDSTVEYTVLAPGVVGYGQVFNTSTEAASDALARLAALVAPYNLTYTAAVDSSNIAGISWLWSPTRLKVVVGS